MDIICYLLIGAWIFLNSRIQLYSNISHDFSNILLELNNIGYTRRCKVKIAVVGAGAMGSLFAGHLAEVEEDVWVYDVWEATRL